MTIRQKFVHFCNELPSFQKDGLNPHFGNNYVTLDQIMAKIAPLEKKYNVKVRHSVSSEVLDNGLLLIRVCPVFTDGDSPDEIIGDGFQVMSSAKIQDNGAVITYARRYTLTTFLGFCSDKDDDGEQQAQDVEKYTNNKVAKPLQAKKASPETIEVLKQKIVKELTPDNAQLIYIEVMAANNDTITKGFMKKINAMGLTIENSKVVKINE